MKTLKLGWVLGLVLALGQVACGKIPSRYRGEYVDSTTGFKLELESGGGKWVRQDGLQHQFKAVAMAAKKLAQGEPGIYLRSVGEALELFWVYPDKQTLREQYGFVSMKAEVLYTRIDSHPGGGLVRNIAARYCEAGQVLVDQLSQSFNGGCPGDSTLLDLKRTVQP